MEQDSSIGEEAGSPAETHLPDCDDYAFSGAGFHPDCERICICRQVRRIEQRVFQEQILGRQYEMVLAYQRGLNAAREAVVRTCYHTKHEGSPPCLHDAYVAGMVTGHGQILRDCDNHYASGYRNGLAAARGAAIAALTDDDGYVRQSELDDVLEAIDTHIAGWAE